MGERIFPSRIVSCIDPVSNDPFLPLICPLLPPVPFGFLQRFCRYFGSGPTFVNKVNPVKTGQDWPRPPKTSQDILDCLCKCVPCLVTFFPHDLPSWLAKGKREEPLLILVQTTSHRNFQPPCGRLLVSSQEEIAPVFTCSFSFKSAEHSLWCITIERS